MQLVTGHERFKEMVGIISSMIDKYLEIDASFDNLLVFFLFGNDDPSKKEIREYYVNNGIDKKVLDVIDDDFSGKKKLSTFMDIEMNEIGIPVSIKSILLKTGTWEEDGKLYAPVDVILMELVDALKSLGIFDGSDDETTGFIWRVLERCNSNITGGIKVLTAFWKEKMASVNNFMDYSGIKKIPRDEFKKHLISMINDGFTLIYSKIPGLVKKFAERHGKITAKPGPYFFVEGRNVIEDVIEREEFNVPFTADDVIGLELCEGDDGKCIVTFQINGGDLNVALEEMTGKVIEHVHEWLDKEETRTEGSEGQDGI
jgi:hypothetical protein